MYCTYYVGQCTQNIGRNCNSGIHYRLKRVVISSHGRRVNIFLAQIRFLYTGSKWDGWSWPKYPWTITEIARFGKIVKLINQRQKSLSFPLSSIHSTLLNKIYQFIGLPFTRDLTCGAVVHATRLKIQNSIEWMKPNMTCKIPLIIFLYRYPIVFTFCGYWTHKAPTIVIILFFLVVIFLFLCRYRY